MGRFLFLIVRLILIVVFPFILFLRTATYLHEKYSLVPSVTILGAIIILSFLLLIYITVINKFLFRNSSAFGLLKHKLLFVLLLVVGFSIHLLFFISNNNLKSQELKSEYLELHPILRLATGILVRFDKKLVITDASRKLEDYESMGLSANQRSLHFPQKDKYVYALDLRTKNRNEIQIFFIRSYFKLMGFDVLRHVGTADHLHVSLHCPKALRK